MPALDKNTRSADPVQRARRAPRPARRHAAGRRSPRRARTTSAVRRVGTPPTTQPDALLPHGHLADRAGHGLELSHARRRDAARFSVGAFDATTLLPESYSSEGPTDDGRLKPDISAPTNVLITPGDPESDEVNACGGTSCATPHVGGAAALLWGEVAADGGAGQRGAARARPPRRAGARHRRAGRGHRLRRRAPAPRPRGAGARRAHAGAELARARHRRALAPAHRRRHARARSSSRSTASRSWRRSRPAGSCRRAGRPRGSPPARTISR